MLLNMITHTQIPVMPVWNSCHVKTICSMRDQDQEQDETCCFRLSIAVTMMQHRVKKT